MRKRHSLFRCEFIVVNDLLKCSSIAILIDEVVVIGRFEHVNIPSNPLSIAQFCENIDLVYRISFQLWVSTKFIMANYFDSHQFLRLIVHAFVDFAVTAFPDQLQQLIFSDLPHSS